MEEQAFDAAGWAEERSSDSLAQAVCRRLEIPDEMEKGRLRTFIEERFSWTQTFARQMAEYEA
jgi:glycosyltransferase involved in cell wall biosynthesis